MKRRIALWATAGFLIAGGWALFAFITSPLLATSQQPVLWTLIGLTCPVVPASFHFHIGLYFYWVMVLNAITYALLGLMVEGLQYELGHAGWKAKRIANS